MANCITEVKQLEFVINETETVCNLYYESNEPANPFWGGGWKHKIFHDITIVDFIHNEIGNFLDWESGKSMGHFTIVP
jgi:hypothetical protein